MAMDSFEDIYISLNAAQRQAVDTIDGPVLVIAGPGTGKTQLLGARVANILRKTDTPPANILCLTFTESGAANMRDRLTRFIGQAAYDVSIGTYHAFGGDLIRRFPQYFQETRLQEPIDELGMHQILKDLTENMSYSNPLKQTRHHLGDLSATISEIKRALITPDQLRAIAQENLVFLSSTKLEMQEIFADFTGMPRGLAKSRPYFEKLLGMIQSHDTSTQPAGPYGSLASIAATKLGIALESADETGKTSPLTEWKNAWLAKDADNRFIFDGELQNRRIGALADTLEAYQSALEARGHYDFDDMILRSIQALQRYPELRYSLQERYLYILLDEFQDTNAAQLKLVQLLADNPIHEGRPNIMAVGDDDQAIYAFQGAQYSNMMDFYGMYREVLVVNLTENYRSVPEVIETAQAIAGQIQARLHGNFPGMTKKLDAANHSLPAAVIERNEFQSAIAERDWTARRIKSLIDLGVPAKEIAVLAPKHKYLEPLVPYLNKYGVSVRYEKRENILEAPIVRELITMSRLVLALESGNDALADHLWPQVLSYDFWGIPTSELWKTAWQVSDSKGELSWSRLMLGHEQLKLPALLLLSIAGKVHTETSEMLLDYMIGTLPIGTHDPSQPTLTSPMLEYLAAPQVQEKDPELFYRTMSHLTVLRARLKEHIRSHTDTILLSDFVRFITMYEEADQQMLNTSPYAQQADAVQLQTVFKAKGLEYRHVFITACQDEVWGGSAVGNANRLTLPANLAPIRHAGANDDERLRILFVALTRARVGLHLTSSLQTFSGKPTRRLKYLDERIREDDSFESMVLPEKYRQVRNEDVSAPGIDTIEADWRSRHLSYGSQAELGSLLAERLQSYRVSPTHITEFLDLEYGGPQKFFLRTLLKFPSAPHPDAQYGTAIHESLEWAQYRTAELGFAPGKDELIEHFVTTMSSKRLTPGRIAIETERGKHALGIWYESRAAILSPSDKAEIGFGAENVRIDDIPLTGRIDRLELDPKSKSITVVDYKTGKTYSKWTSDIKLFRYKLQLILYKLLVENSRTYRGYHVQKGRLEFIEPDEHGRMQQLELQFTKQDEERAVQLIRTFWSHVHDLNFPDVSVYAATAAGIKKFEQDLLDGKI